MSNITNGGKWAEGCPGPSLLQLPVNVLWFGYKVYPQKAVVFKAWSLPGGAMEG
jgi:hypothetical protein